MICLLIGVSHGYQYDGNKDVDISSFYDLLNSKCDEFDPDLIAEEMNEEAIERKGKYGATGSVAKNVASSRKLNHLFCDPTDKERIELGIPTQKEIFEQLGIRGLQILSQEQLAAIKAKEMEYWEIRERFWLNKLIQARARIAIFILGADHVQRFQQILEPEGISVDVLFEHWRP